MPITRAEEHFWKGTGILTDATPLPAIGSALVISGGASTRGNGVAVNPASTPGIPIFAIATEAATLVNEEISLCRQGIVLVTADDSNAISIGDNITAGIQAGLFKVATGNDHVCGVAMSAAAGSAAGEQFLLMFYGDGFESSGSGVNLGTVSTGVTAVEHGNAYNKTTVLTVSSVLPAIAGGADLAVGKLLYTLPAGDCIIESCYMSMALTAADGNIDADTPDGGLGTVIASGAVAVLSGTATFEDLITGQAFNNCTGTAEVVTLRPTAGVPLIIPAASAHTIHFNVADGWAASGEAACPIAGTVIVNWRFLA